MGRIVQSRRSKLQRVKKNETPKAKDKARKTIQVEKTGLDLNTSNRIER